MSIFVTLINYFAMRIFLLIPFSEDFSDITHIIREATKESNHELIRIDDIISNSSITDIMLEEIEKADLIIADISSKNPNVMYELGIVQTLKKPILMIAQKGESTPFDISHFRVLYYDRIRLNDTLFIQLKSVLSNFNPKDFTRMKNVQHEKKTVFISYSHIDIEYLERLKIHLRPFEKKGLVDIWSDAKIKAGEKWKEQIEKALGRSVVAILLISADFLASDFIVDNELPPLLKSAERKGKIILPVVLKPCRFTRDENLSKFKSINDPKIPLSKMDENGREEIYVEISNYIDDNIK